MTKTERIIDIGILCILVGSILSYILILNHLNELKDLEDLKKQNFTRNIIWQTKNTTFGGNLDYYYDRNEDGTWNISLSDSAYAGYRGNVHGQFSPELINQDIILQKVNYIEPICIESWIENGNIVKFNNTDWITGCDNMNKESEIYLIGVTNKTTTILIKSSVSKESKND